MQYLSHYLNNQAFFSPTLLRAVNNVRAQYPNSTLIQKLSPQIRQLEAYLKDADKKHDGATIINTNYLNIYDLLAQFKGKNILLDVWATWCPPCIEDFDHKSKVASFLSKHDVISLYISIDKENNTKKWESALNYNQLSGYHVLANNMLVKSLWEYLDTNTGRIPRYALIDADGNIFMKEAARPSNSDKLLEQLNKLVNRSQEH